MARTRRQVEPLETIREVPDAQWGRIEPILSEDAPLPPKGHGGRGRIDWRAALDGIIFRLRSGCQWNKVPAKYGDDSSVHRWFRRWCRNGVFAAIWAQFVEECDELGGVRWHGRRPTGGWARPGLGGKRRARTRPIGPSRGRSQGNCAMMGDLGRY